MSEGEIHLEIEHGDRRASASLPARDISLEQLQHITVWLSATSERWEIR